MRFSLRCEGDGNLRSFVTIVVDVANVMGSRPDGWWRDRAGAAVRLHAQIARLAASGRAILPSPGDRSPGAGPGLSADDPGPSADEPGSPEEDPPAFVLVLEGAARAAVSRLPSASPATGDVAGGTSPTGGTSLTGGTSPTGAVGAAGPPQPGEVRVVEAPGSGDDAIVAVVRELPGRRVVVTADRELRARCVAAGAEILGPGWLLGLL
jgi:8-oxo-dGTP diphosphatase